MHGIECHLLVEKYIANIIHPLMSPHVNSRLSFTSCNGHDEITTSTGCMGA